MLSWDLVFAVLFTVGTVVQICLDLKEGMLYDWASLLLGVTGFAYGIYRGVWVEYCLGGLVAFAALGMMYICGRGAMGSGDVLLAGALGLWLSPSESVVMLAAAFVSGGVAGIILLLMGYGRKAHLPFGPCLVFGCVIALFYGQTIIKWYLGVM